MILLTQFRNKRPTYLRLHLIFIGCFLLISSCDHELLSKILRFTRIYTKYSRPRLAALRAALRLHNAAKNPKQLGFFGVVTLRGVGPRFHP